MRTNPLLKLLFAFCILFATKLTAQITPANNKLGIAAYTPPQNPTFDFDSCFHLCQTSGMNEYQLSLNWSSLEPTMGSTDFSIIDIANYYFPLYNMPVNLVLAPISTNVNERPADLSNTPFNAFGLINRFNALLDSIKLHGPAINYSSLVIGNEIDVYLGSNATQWAEYTTFLDSASSHAQLLWPGINIATKITFKGLIETSTSSFAQQINSHCDYIGATYYPLNNDFTVKPVSVVPLDFDTIVALYPNKPICFYECGFPSSPACNSSDSLQKEFMTQIFQSWDAHAANIRLVDFLWLHDLDTATINYFETYYGISDTIFLEYLRTLGLRTWGGNGTDKPAFTELQCQARQHAYNNLVLNCATGIAEESGAIQILTISPNPAQDEIAVQIPPDFFEGEIQIMNTNGQIVLSSQCRNEADTHLDISQLPSGLYTLVLTNESCVQSERFVITK